MTLVRTLITGIAMACGLTNGQTMRGLRSSRYFADPVVAAFVDDVQRGNVKRVRKALAAGVSPSAPGIDGFRPIHFVFVASDTDVLTLLLEAGADPNARLANGNTPLHFAVRMPSADFTRVLLAAGADPTARGANDKPVLHEATDYEQTETLELLVRGGADINRPWGGHTPLIGAVMGLSWKSAVTLLQLGADPSLRDIGGETAEYWWCKQLHGMPVVERYRGKVLALADAFAARGVTLRCADELARFRR